MSMRPKDAVALHPGAVAPAPGDIPVTRVSSSRLSERVREESPFGTVFSDHVLVADYRGGRWETPTILPYSPMPLPPAPSALHYGQTLFEGFKAHRTVDGGVALFRPRDNYARLNRSAARLAIRAQASWGYMLCREVYMLFRINVLHCFRMYCTLFAARTGGG